MSDRLLRSPGQGVPTTEAPVEGSITVRMPGVEHDAPTRRTVFYYGCAVAALALFGTLPAMWEIREHLHTEHSSGIAPWAYLLLWLGVVQLGYAVYLDQH